MDPRLGQAATVAVSALVALALVEGGLLLTDHFVPPEKPIKAAQPELYQADAAVGYRLWPSRTTMYRYPRTSEELIPVVSNSDGFRSHRELDEPDHRPRILVVGDSFVFGSGVRQEDRFTEQLESAEPGWRVDNMGMTGWGLDLMVRAIEKYAPKAKPDVVVLAVYTDDFRRLLPYYAGAGYGHDKFELRGSELVTVPYPYPEGWERRRIVQLLYRTMWQVKRNRYDLNEALLDRYLKDSKTMGFRPVVAFFPGTDDTAEDRERRGFLRDWAVRHNVPYVDLTNAIQSLPVEQLFISDKWHWNRDGHRVAAEQLRDFLLQLREIPAPGSGAVQQRPPGSRGFSGKGISDDAIQ